MGRMRWGSIVGWIFVASLWLISVIFALGVLWYQGESNRFYPEFVLTGYKVISNHPAPIFRDPSATDPERLYIDKPQ